MTNATLDVPISSMPEAMAPPIEAILPALDQGDQGDRGENRWKWACRIARSALRWPLGIWGALDVLTAFSGFILAHYLSPQFNFTQTHTYNIAGAAAAFSAVLFCANYALGLYDRHSFASVGRIIRCAILANLVAAAGTTLGFSWIAFIRIGRHILLDAFILSATGTVLLRLVARGLATWAKIRIVFVGHRRSFQSLEDEIARLYPGFYYRPVYVDWLAGSAAQRESQLLGAVQRHEPDEIVVEDNDSIILDLLSQSSVILRSGCEIRSHAAYFESLLGQIPVDVVNHRSVLGCGLSNARYGLNLVKRALDVVLAGVGLVVGIPAFLVSALLVRLSSPGPILYSQIRVGRYGKPFWIYKFRTMRVDAEENGAVWAKENDDRTTFVGRLLRKSRLDELPQLWNILRGDMSFVGPRPERPEFVAKLRDRVAYYDLRHLVPPGLTGWAQIRYRYGSSVEDARRKLAFDLYYVRHYSPTFDLAICLRTFVAMAKGAR